MEVKLDEFSKDCTCGKRHKLFVERVLIEEGAIYKVSLFLHEYGVGDYPVVICDTNTYQAAGRQVFELLENEDKNLIILDAKDLHADEYGVEKIMKSLKEEATVLLAIGAGTVHDLTRYVAKERQIPFIAIPTAASVDGFVSTVAAMTLKGFKVTYPAVSPLAVFADTEIIRKAPYRLTASGVADLLGKYTAILDWQIAHLITGEYICEEVIDIELSAVKKVEENLRGIREGSKEAYEDLMYALILSGLAMQMVGNSRPASGAEHHMSHLWEMQIINPQLEALHGEKVGVALAIVCDHYKQVLSREPHTIWKAAYKGLPYGSLKENFKHLYDSIVEENEPDLLKDTNFSLLLERFEEIKKCVEKLPSGEVVRRLLETAGAKTTLQDIGLQDNIVGKSIRLSPFVRRRITLMRLLNSGQEIE